MSEVLEKHSDLAKRIRYHEFGTTGLYGTDARQVSNDVQELYDALQAAEDELAKYKDHRSLVKYIRELEEFKEQAEERIADMAKQVEKLEAVGRKYQALALELTRSLDIR